MGLKRKSSASSAGNWPLQWQQWAASQPVSNPPASWSCLQKRVHLGVHVSFTKLANHSLGLRAYLLLFISR
eukprot:1816031-Amphidinium_carterae.1